MIVLDRLQPPNRRWFTIAGTILAFAMTLVLIRMEHAWEGHSAKRIAQGAEHWLAEDYGRLYGFWIGLANVGLLTAALLTSRWWWPLANPVRNAPPEPGPKPLTAPVSRPERWILVLLVVLAAWIRIPTLDGPLLRDEQDNVRYQIHGFHRMDAKTEHPQFQAATWADGLWRNRFGNNPVLTSIVCRASLSAWHALSGAPREVFSRWALRVPILFVGLATVVASWWMARALAPPRVALTVAALAVLHPLMIHYSMEARGYGFVLLGVCLSLGATVRGLQREHWGYWALVAGAYFMILSAYYGAALYVLGTAAVILVVLFTRMRHGVPDAATGLTRFLLAGTVAAGGFFQLVVPSVMCLLHQEHPFPWRMTFNADWLLSVWTNYTVGHSVPLPSGKQGWLDALGYLGKVQFAARPWLWLLAVAVTALAFLGFKRVRRTTVGTPARFLVAAGLLAAVTQTVIHFGILQRALFFFYLIYALPLVLLLASLGLEEVAVRLESLPVSFALPNRAPWTTVLPAAFLMLYFGFATHPKPALSPEHFATQRGPVVFDRGHYHWIAYPTGQCVRIPLQDPVPETFPR